MALSNARLSVRASACRNCGRIKSIDRFVIFGLKRKMQLTTRIRPF